MEITSQELDTLNFYRASELQGGLVLGYLVGRVTDSDLILNLTRHSAEELVHAQVWTETILAVGGEVRPIRNTFQNRFRRIVDRPGTVLHVLAATQVLERRAYRHFLEHLRRPGTHRRIQSALYRMLSEERYHLSWVKEWLDRQASDRGQDISSILTRYQEADEVTYTELLKEFGWVEAA